MAFQSTAQKTQTIKLGCQILHHEDAHFLYYEMHWQAKVQTKHPSERKYCNKHRPTSTIPHTKSSYKAEIEVQITNKKKTITQLENDWRKDSHKNTKDSEQSARSPVIIETQIREGLFPTST